jgi:anti-sigma B factor antagonist
LTLPGQLSRLGLMRPQRRHARALQAVANQRIGPLRPLGGTPWLRADSLDVRHPLVPSGDEHVEKAIDVYTAPKLREQLAELVDSGRYDLVVDMTGVEFLDSTGLGVLVGGLKRVRMHDGSLRLVCTQERILKIFRITGLTKVFPIHESVADAVAADST